METIFQISLESNVLREAENAASIYADTTLTELVSDFIQQIANNKPFEVNSYDELVESLLASREQYKNGQTVSYKDFKNYINEKRSNRNVSH